MSYILEALKKSQEERELGRVPTLDSQLGPFEGRGARVNPWSLAALALAMLAVAIAIYGTLIRNRTAPPPMATAAPVEPAPPSARPPDMLAAQPPRTIAPAVEPVASPANPQPVPAPVAAPRIEPEPPARPEPRPTRPGRLNNVPDDLVADIEAFKRNLAPDEAGPRPMHERVPPPDDVAVSLPAMVVTAHIYDADPAKRFVVINGLRVGQGETSREGVRVDEIEKEGIWLEYRGYAFYRSR